MIEVIKKRTNCFFIFNQKKTSLGHIFARETSAPLVPKNGNYFLFADIVVGLSRADIFLSELMPTMRSAQMRISCVDARFWI